MPTGSCMRIITLPIAGNTTVRAIMRIVNMIQGATPRESANVYGRSTAISPMSVKIVEISCFET